jgi:hypothetical protein
MLPIGRATFGLEEFLAACEYALGYFPETVALYREKITPFLRWAQQKRPRPWTTQTVHRFFRWLERLACGNRRVPRLLLGKCRRYGVLELVPSACS